MEEKDYEVKLLQNSPKYPIDITLASIITVGYQFMDSKLPLPKKSFYVQGKAFVRKGNRETLSLD
jgi:hypothetical protein